MCVHIKWVHSYLGSTYSLWILDLDSLAVHPAFQGRGFGSLLMSAVIEEARKEDLNIALCATEGKDT